jgi:hypothetical protein
VRSTDEWKDIIYTAIGVPEAVVNKKDIAATLLEKQAPPPSQKKSDVNHPARQETARAAILDNLSGQLLDGGLDLLLVRSENVAEAAERLAKACGAGEAEDQYARRLIIASLLPSILRVVEGRYAPAQPGPLTSRHAPSTSLP